MGLPAVNLRPSQTHLQQVYLPILAVFKEENMKTHTGRSSVEKM